MNLLDNSHFYNRVRNVSDCFGATNNKGAENQPLYFLLVGMRRLERPTPTSRT